MIDQQDMAQEYIKCYSDASRAYFIEHYLKTFDGTEGRDVPFKLFPRQKVFLQAIPDFNKVIAIKHRQSGISTTTSAYISGEIVFTKKDSPQTILCVANKKEQAIELVTKIKNFLEQVPRWMWGDEYYSPDENSEKNKKDVFLKKSQAYLELFNGCKVYARASGPNSARGISSVSILALDESAFLDNGPAMFANCIATTSAVKNAKVIMVSTPNGKDQLYYQTYKQAQENRNGFKVVEFKWHQDLRYNRFLKWYKKNDNTGELEWKVEETIDEKGNIRYEPDKWRELERSGWKPTSPWYEKMCQSMNNDSIRIAQELDVSFLGSSDNVVPAEVIERIRLRDVRDPLSDYGDKTEDLTWFWKAPIEGHRYILACDVSMGSSEDRTSIQVIDADGKDEYGMPYLEQIMEYNGRVLGDKLGDMLYKYGTLYNNAYIVVDATGGTGDACLLRLMNYWGYKNLYYDDNVMKQYMKITNKSNENFAERMPGFHFQGNRFSLLRNCANMISDGSFTVHSVRLCNELDTWIFKGEDGRMDHMAGSHDDNITCIAMALFIYKFSFQKLEATKSRDAAILNAYMRGGGYRPKENAIKEGEPIVSKATSLPFYSSRHVGTVKEMSDGRFGPYLWLRAGYK